MIMSLLGLLAMSAAGDGGPIHRTTIHHGAVPVNVDYRAAITLRVRQAGMTPPTRMGVLRCDWVARVAVHRSMERPGAASAPNRIVADDFELRGNRPGTCSAARKAIDAEIAGRDTDVRAHLLAVADRDRTQLMAEIETTGTSPHSAH